MFKIIGIIIAGVLVGRIFDSKIKPKQVSVVLTVIICLLLLILGISVGANDNIISNLGTLGYNALIIALGSVLGSVIIALLLNKVILNKTVNSKKS